LLEVHEPWGKKVPRDGELADEVHARLGQWAAAMPGLRVQFIRRPGQAPVERRLFYAALDGDGVHVEERTLPSIEAMTELELDEVEAAARARREPLEAAYFVCTHGARDRCCAKWGMPVYQALTDRRPERTWQTSHLGGHRFAPTLLSLPAGLVYGRVSPEEVGRMLAAEDRGEIHDLGRVRGRINMSAAAQFADLHVRGQLGLRRIDAMTWRGDAPGSAVERIEVTMSAESQDHRVELCATTGPSRLGSCGDPPTASRSLRIVDAS
jgi:hypothetical protein